MRVEIFRVPPGAGEWAQASAPYSFLPQSGDAVPVATIEVPDGWMLFGHPEPLLVRRTSPSDFTTRSATEVFYHGLVGAEGFKLLDASGSPGDGTPWSSITPLIGAIPSQETPALPAPKPSRRSRDGGSARRPGRS